MGRTGGVHLPCLGPDSPGSDLVRGRGSGTSRNWVSDTTPGPSHLSRTTAPDSDSPLGGGRPGEGKDMTGETLRVSFLSDVRADPPGRGRLQNLQGGLSSHPVPSSSPNQPGQCTLPSRELTPLHLPLRDPDRDAPLENTFFPTWVKWTSKKGRARLPSSLGNLKKSGREGGRVPVFDSNIFGCLQPPTSSPSSRSVSRGRRSWRTPGHYPSSPVHAPPRPEGTTGRETNVIT